MSSKLFRTTVFVFLTTLSQSTLTWAGALMSLSGKLTSMTNTQYVIEAGNSLYYVDAKAIPPEVKKKLTKTGVNVTIQVTFQDIQAIKPVEK